MQRVPLRELPLKHFTHPVQDAWSVAANSQAPSRRPSKRPLSPDAVTFCSPAKRRTHRAQEVVSIPAKANQGSTRARSPSAMHSHPQTSIDESEIRLANCQITPPEHDTDPLGASPLRDMNSTQELLYLVIPRELPSSADPYSAHYPGFRVYRDPYLCIPNSRHTKTEETPNATQLLAPTPTKTDPEGFKENRQPPRIPIAMRHEFQYHDTSEKINSSLNADAKERLGSLTAGTALSVNRTGGHTMVISGQRELTSPSAMEKRYMLRKIMEAEADTVEMEMDEQDSDD